MKRLAIQDELGVDLDLDRHDVSTLAELHAKAEQETTFHQRLIETLTARLGRPGTLYFLLAAVLLWAGYNFLASRLSLPRLDSPPFVWLQGAIGLMALLMTIVVLITQQRQSKMAARRALLDLHVNLLAERKAAKLIALIEELRRDLPSVGNRRDRQAEAMSQPVEPQKAIDELEAQIAQTLTGPSLRNSA